MTVLSLHGGAKGFRDRPLFTGLHFELQPGAKVGLVGPNGSGKTTLLRILGGLEEPDRGVLATASGATVGYLRQDVTFAPEDTVLSAALAAFAPLWAMEAEMHALEARMASPPDAAAGPPSLAPPAATTAGAAPAPRADHPPDARPSAAATAPGFPPVPGPSAMPTPPLPSHGPLPTPTPSPAATPPLPFHGPLPVPTPPAPASVPAPTPPALPTPPAPPPPTSPSPSPPPASPFDPLARYGDLLARFESLGGYTALARTRQTLAGLGFPPSRLSDPCSVLSGGERVRLSLVRLLLEAPTALLLDEPTNHLDLPAIRWLEEHLRRSPIAAVIVSHDRHFLDVVTTQTLEMSSAPRLFRGNYSQYLHLRGAGEAAGMEAYRRAQAELPQLRAFIASLRAGYNPVPKTRLRRLAELEAVPVPQVAAKSIQVAPAAIPVPISTSPAVELAGVAKAYGEHALLGADGFTAAVTRGDRIGLIGPNGSGKSTLLRILLGAVAPDAGTYAWSAGTRLGWLPQSLEALDPDLTLVQQLTALPGVGTRQARDILARFLFEGDAVFARTGDCSGGERCRVALARLLLQPWDALLLDEPTNHLDMESRRALEDGLAGYPGTILVASHDRFFLDRVAWRLWVFADGVTDFDGNYSAWAQGEAGDSAAALAAAIRSAEARLATLRVRLSQSATFTGGRGHRLSREWKATQTELADLQKRWREATRGGGG